MKSQRKKHGHCPIPTCTSTKGRNKGRLRHMPAKWTDLPKDVREAIANELRKLFGDLHDLLCKYISGKKFIIQIKIPVRTNFIFYRNT